ncbi:MAG: carbohydrate-binding protein [Flavobacteriaceae bacterium]|nr:carbohydrate-binding protein [Flavobacteriaceae bacterium]
MKNINYNYLKIILLFGSIFTIIVSCESNLWERELSEDAEFATFSPAAEVFIDGFSGGLSYDPFGDSKLDAFSVDDEVKYSGTASMRFDVPSFGDPSGPYAGATFRDAIGRDLTEYDALTFWVKASQAATLNSVGFGEDFEGGKYLVTLSDVQVTTFWQKIIIPIPDPSKLNRERGMFWYAEGPEDGEGYTFWIDELQFEKLGNIGQPRPAILDGVDVNEPTFIGNMYSINGTQTFNLGSGLNQTVSAAPSYFSYSSTDPEIARVNEQGVVTILDAGTARVTGILGGVMAEGSITFESQGDFDAAPAPPDRDPNDVISIFSDAYTNVAVDYFNGFWAPYQTTQGGSPPVNVGGGQVINYTDLNFVGIGTFLDVPTINATDMTHLHIDIYVNEPLDSGDFVSLSINNDVGNNETSGTITFDSNALFADDWVSLDIPLTDFSGLGDRSQLGLIIFVTDATISNIFVDNIYYYR